MDGLSRELRIDQAARGLPPDQFRTFCRLARELEAHAGRWGSFLLQYEHDADRQAVAEAIDALCERPARVEISPEQFSQWADLEVGFVRVVDAADAIQIFGLDEWLDDRSDRARTESLMRAWNVRRDGFRPRRAGSGLVLAACPQR